MLKEQNCPSIYSFVYGQTVKVTPGILRHPETRKARDWHNLKQDLMTEFLHGKAEQSTIFKTTLLLNTSSSKLVHNVNMEYYRLLSSWQSRYRLEPVLASSWCNSYSKKKTLSYKSHFEAMALQVAWSNKTKCIKLLGTLQRNLAGITVGLKHHFKYDQLINRLDAVHCVSNDRKGALLKLSTCKKTLGRKYPTICREDTAACRKSIS